MTNIASDVRETQIGNNRKTRDGSIKSSLPPLPLIFVVYFLFIVNILNATTLDEVRNQNLCIKLSDSKKEECFVKIEQKAIQQQSRVKRVGNILTIQRKQKNILLKSIPNAYEQTILYVYKGFLQDMDYHIVLYRQWEGGGLIFISEASGEQFFMYEIPHLSPSKTKMVSVSAYEAYNPNEIVVFKITPEKLTEEYRFDIKDYRLYEFVSWDEEDTIKLKNFTIADKKICPKSAFMTIFETLKNTNGKWQLYRDDADIACK